MQYNPGSMADMQNFSRAEALVAKAVHENFVLDLRVPPPEGKTLPSANFIQAQARLYSAAKENPNFLEDLAELDLSRENPHLKNLIEKILRRLIPTELELLSGLTLPDISTDPSNLIDESIGKLHKRFNGLKKFKRFIRIPFVEKHEVHHSDDYQRAAIEIRDFKIQARICFLMSGLGKKSCPSTNIVIQSEERFLHAMYPGGRRSNLLFAWISKQPHDSLPQIVSSIAVLDKWLMKNREVNNTRGTTSSQIFLHRVGDRYPFCLKAFSDLVPLEF